jgi:hypothetical protein
MEFKRRLDDWARPQPANPKPPKGNSQRFQQPLVDVVEAATCRGWKYLIISGRATGKDAQFFP